MRFVILVTILATSVGWCKGQVYSIDVFPSSSTVLSVTSTSPQTVQNFMVWANQTDGCYACSVVSSVPASAADNFVFSPSAIAKGSSCSSSYTSTCTLQLNTALDPYADVTGGRVYVQISLTDILNSPSQYSYQAMYTITVPYTTTTSTVTTTTSTVTSTTSTTTATSTSTTTSTSTSTTTTPKVYSQADTTTLAWVQTGAGIAVIVVCCLVGAALLAVALYYAIKPEACGNGCNGCNNAQPAQQAAPKSEVTNNYYQNQAEWKGSPSQANWGGSPRPTFTNAGTTLPPVNV